MKQLNLEVRRKKLIEVDGLKFKDLNGNGKLDPYEDWRLSPEERAKDLVSQMTKEEKAGMMMITTQGMGLSQEDKSLTSMDGILNDYVGSRSGIFADQAEYGNTKSIEEKHLRHFILRENHKPSEMATWINAMNEVAEGTRLGVPVLIASNSRNENAERTFGMNDAVGIFSTWPGTLGLAAAVLGDMAQGKDAELFSEFAEIARKEWTATGIRKGYMYMLDVVTDPRWQRIYGTFGENTDLIVEAAKRLLMGFQGEELDENSVALTMKHFPGGGARENGFDPHYKEGKWNIYPTEGSLEKYHLPPFQTAADYNTSSIMPYYSIPASEKSAKQMINGEEMPFEDVGFAFNKSFIEDLLRKKMGFKGYINSDSGILDKMCWGVEDMERQDRAAKAINSGTDIIADTNEVEWVIQAIDEGKVSMDRIDEAVARLAVEMFELGIFDNKTYVDPQEADKVVANKENWDKAYQAHLKSAVLLKNKDTLPLKEGTKVYVEAFHKEAEKAEPYLKDAVEAINKQGKLQLVDKAEDADALIFLIYPKSGNYFTATPGFLELALCEDQTNYALDGEAYQETTVSGLDRMHKMAKEARERGAKVIYTVNTILPWLFDSIEPEADALIAHFETLVEAQFEIISGMTKPTGKLPMTLPAGNHVIAVDEEGKCVSPNDVPGYDKQKYMPDDLHYAYVDEAGNDYIMGFGLSY